MTRGRLKTAFPALRSVSLCAPVPKVNGYGRPACGLLFFSQSGFHRPSRFAQLNASGFTHFDFIAGGISGIANDQFNAADWNNHGLNNEPRVAGYAELRILTAVPSRLYFQTSQGWQTTARPGIALIGTNGFAGISVEADHALAGQENAELSAVGAGLQRSAMANTSPDMLAFEVRPSDGFARGWHDSGGDPRAVFLGGAGLSTLAGPCYAALIMKNNQNGFREGGSWGDIVLCRERAVALHGPNNGSVRITVNGVVQVFAGPVNYINLSAAGLVSWDPQPGVWFPSSVRFEFFTAAALGGIVAADITIPTLWGGDAIGL